MSRGVHSSRVPPPRRPDSLINSKAIFRLAGTCLVEFFADGALLFSEQGQRLIRLEGASALLGPLLERGTRFAELIEQLGDHDVGGDMAEGWVTSLLHQLAGLSLLEAKGFDDRPPTAGQSLQLGPLEIGLSYSDDEVRDLVAPIFAHLESEAATQPSLQISDFGAALAQIRENGNPAILVPCDQLAVRIKGILLDKMFAAAGSFAALHGALVGRGGSGVLLLGSPGAGKSTLALALLSRGYGYGSDDVTLINRDGTVSGVPLAPGVKEGSWTIAEDLGAALTPLPAYLRPDGQGVRFVHIDRDKLVGPCRVSAIVVLRRSVGSACELRPIGSERALAELLRESKATGGICTVETMSALATLVRGAACFELHYGEAMEAADVVASIPSS